MNRRIAWIWGLVTAGIAVVVGLLAYHAGQVNQVATTTTNDGRVFYPGYFGFGFFPFFGFFWIVLIGLLLLGIFRRRGPWYGGGYWHQHPHEHGGGGGTSTPPTVPTVPPGPDQPKSA